MAYEALENGPLHQLAKAIYRINRDNGWFEGPERSVSDELMLIVGEVAEAHEEDRKGYSATHRYYTYSFPATSGYGVEIAGGEIRYFLRGEEVPWSTIPPEYAKPEGIPSEMADIIIRVLDFCHRHKIDIEEVLLEKLTYNTTRGHRHGGKRL
jgi:hypothetical protein